MRIIAGTAGGTILALPKGREIRPTPDKVKQAIFSSLGERIVGARVLDLFAGSGALGLEAASRGAAKAILVDDSRYSVEAAVANARKTRLDDRVQVLCEKAFRYVEDAARQGETFDFVFADPPYEKTGRGERSLARMLLNCPSLVSILAANGELVMEHFKNDALDLPLRWQARRELRHGDTLVSFIVPRP